MNAEKKKEKTWKDYSCTTKKEWVIRNKPIRFTVEEHGRSLETGCFEPDSRAYKYDAENMNFLFKVTWEILPEYAVLVTAETVRNLRAWRRAVKTGYSPMIEDIFENYLRRDRLSGRQKNVLRKAREGEYEWLVDYPTFHAIDRFFHLALKDYSEIRLSRWHYDKLKDMREDFRRKRAKGYGVPEDTRDYIGKTFIEHFDDQFYKGLYEIQRKSKFEWTSWKNLRKSDWIRLNAYAWVIDPDLESTVRRKLRDEFATPDIYYITLNYVRDFVPYYFILPFDFDQIEEWEEEFEGRLTRSRGFKKMK